MMFESFGDDAAAPTRGAPVSVTAWPLTAASLFGIGTYLVLQRKLSRIIVGLGLLGHGANVLLILSRPARRARRSSARGDPADFADPLPQALVLTAIVISFGVTALLLALAYRSWLLTATTRSPTTSRTVVVARAQRPRRRRARRRRPRSTADEDAAARRRDVNALLAAADRAAAARRGGLDARRPVARLPSASSASSVLTAVTVVAIVLLVEVDARRARRRRRPATGRRPIGITPRRRPPVGDHARRRLG